MRVVNEKRKNAISKRFTNHKRNMNKINLRDRHKKRSRIDQKHDSNKKDKSISKVCTKKMFGKNRKFKYE